MFVKPKGPLEDIKNAVFHHTVKAEHLNFCAYIYIFYYQSSICLLLNKTVASLIFRIFDIKSDLPEFRNSPNAKFSSLTSCQYATDVMST